MADVCDAAEAKALVSGLQDLRRKGLLCDVALTGGEQDAGKRQQHLAHQAVLAAASKPLRNYFVSTRDGADHLPTPPKPQELRLVGLASPHEAASAALRHIYGSDMGSGIVEAAPDIVSRLSAALGLTDLERDGDILDPEVVVTGLNDLRAKGSLCDIVIMAGGRRFAAHQAVLAAASSQLRRYIVDQADQLAAAAYGEPEETMGVVSRNLELELPGIKHAEALAVMLDHIYVSPKADLAQQPPTRAVAWEIAQLAQSLGLPKLRERTSRWLADNFVADVELDAAEGLAEPDEVDDAAADVEKTLRSHFEEPGRKRKQERKHEKREPKESQSQQEPEVPMEDQEATPATEELTAVTQEEEALQATQSCRYAETRKVPGKTTMPDRIREEFGAREEGRLGKLQALFDERPVWLEQALLEKLPPVFGEGVFTRLIPFVAYQWVDGPWQGAYARLGWDPRKNAEEAKMLQVLIFRDPYLASQTKQEDKEAEPSDCHFKRPPSQRQQAYQLIDIKDDFINSLVVATDAEKKCSKATGWLPPDILNAAKDALTMKSQRLREKEGANKKGAVAARASTGGRSSLAAGRRGSSLAGRASAGSKGSRVSLRSSGARSSGDGGSAASRGRKIGKAGKAVAGAKLQKTKARLSQALRRRLSTGQGGGRPAKIARVKRG